MKLATYQDGSRDGQLVVVSADLTQAHHASGIATRLQQVLDDWNFLAPQLQDLARTLEQGKARHAFAFEPRLCLAPLPRVCRLVDAQPSLEVEMAGDVLAGARSVWPDTCTDVGARLVVALGDVPRGAGEDQARDAVRLVMLAHHGQHRAAGGAVAASLACAPVAVTPEALGPAWHRGRLAMRLQTVVDGRVLAPVELAAAGGVSDAGGWIARLARHRAVSAGTLLALPGGPARVALDGVGQVDTAVCDALGQSVFGAVVQRDRP
jgi:fumarylacetoacetate (FAA) hydrolase